MWKQINPNPCGRYVGDCVVRALSIALNHSWKETYLSLCITGFVECDMPSANHVWGKYLEENGYYCQRVDGWRTVRQWADALADGNYILATGSHVIAVMDGDYYDAWDSGNEIPIEIWKER